MALFPSVNNGPEGMTALASGETRVLVTQLKGIATHSSILAWRIPWTEEPGKLQFMGLQRVGLD